MTSVQHTVELQSLNVPESIFMVPTVGLKQDGLRAVPSFRLRELSEDAIRKLTEGLFKDMMSARQTQIDAYQESMFPTTRGYNDR